MLFIDLSLCVAFEPKEWRRLHFLIKGRGNLGEGASCWVAGALESVRRRALSSPWGVHRGQEPWRESGELSGRLAERSSKYVQGSRRVSDFRRQGVTPSFRWRTWRMPHALVLSSCSARKLQETSSQTEHLRFYRGSPGWSGIVLIHTLCVKSDPQSWWSNTGRGEQSPGERLITGGSGLVGTGGPGSRSEVCEEGLPAAVPPEVTGSSRTSQGFFLLSRLPSSRCYVTAFPSTLSTVSQLLPKRKRDGPQRLLSTFRIICYWVPEMRDVFQITKCNIQKWPVLN